MKNLVKAIINMINENKVFVISVCVLAGVVSLLLREFGAALAFLFFAAGIRGLVMAWREASNAEEGNVRIGARLFCTGGIFFFSAGILNIVKEILVFRGLPAFGLEYVVTGMVYIGVGCIGLFFIGVVLYLAALAWNSLVRWAR